MSETNPNAKQEGHIFSFIQSFIYLFIILDIYFFAVAPSIKNPLVLKINAFLSKLSILTNPYYAHLTVFFAIVVIGLFSEPKKNIHFHPVKHVIIPLCFGLLFFVSSLLLLVHFQQYFSIASYGISYLIGAVMLNVAFTNISKKIKSGIKDDIWNTEEESFPQNTIKDNSLFVFNLPMRFYYKKKYQNGWINIDPFRGTTVIGVPGSGKTASVLIPCIKQAIFKEMACCIYDFKYPDLAEMAYFHYLKNKENGKLQNFSFNVVNLDHIEKSCRVNPIAKRYIQTLADAFETAEAVILALTKSQDTGSGSGAFFTTSAINFLGAIIYYLSRYDKGQYCTIPHVIAFISQSYDAIFTALFSEKTLVPVLSAYRSAYENSAFDQLEGQIGTLRINISKLATQEAFWIFTGDDIDFKISRKESPSILVLANNPNTQSINSTFFASILLRVTKEINSKQNQPSAIFVDEMPTVYLHNIQNLIATARSNKVAVMLGLQEISQLTKEYGEKTSNIIQDIMGSVLSGAVRSKKTLDWLQNIFGKIKQVTQGVSINENKTNISYNERLDYLIPSAKITNLKAGEIVGIVAENPKQNDEAYKPSVFNCKVMIDFKQIAHEESLYVKTPNYYDFGNKEEMKQMLEEHYLSVFNEIETIVNINA